MTDRYDVVVVGAGNAAFCAAHAAADHLRDKLLKFVHVFQAVQGASGEFRVGCHSRHLTQLKELGEELGASARDLDTLLDGTNRSRVP